jgi:hypothetical protein
LLGGVRVATWVRRDWDDVWDSDVPYAGIALGSLEDDLALGSHDRSTHADHALSGRRRCASCEVVHDGRRPHAYDTRARASLGVNGASQVR